MPNKLSQFWQELKRRNVVRVITVYTGAAFVILSLVDMIREPFELPNWSFKLVVVILTVGLIIAVILSWIYDIHPEGGMVKTEPADKIKPEEHPGSSKGWKVASYISFVVIVGMIVLYIKPGAGKKEVSDKSIAVLTFIDESPGLEDTYKISAYRTAVHDNLCQIKELRVLSLESAEQYKGQAKSHPEIAKELGVGYLLSARGQILKNRIRLTVQLEDANGKMIWSNPYDRQIELVEDHIDIQSDIAQLVARRLEATITPAEKQLLDKVPTSNLTAYDLILQAQKYFSQYTLTKDWNYIERVSQLCNEALDLDPDFALAYYWLGKSSLSEQADDYMAGSLKPFYLDTALFFFNKALELDPDLPEAYAERGIYSVENAQGQQAIEDLNKAIKLSPSNSTAYLNLGNIYYYSRDFINALINLRKAETLIRSNDMLVQLYRDLLFLYVSIGDLDKAESFVRKMTRIQPSYGLQAEIALSEVNANYSESLQIAEECIDKYPEIKGGYIDKAISLLHLGRKQEAEECIRTMLEFANPDVNNAHRVGIIFWMNGKRDEAMEYFNMQIDYCMKSIQSGTLYGQTTAAYDLAGVYAFLGQTEEAMRWLREYERQGFISGMQEFIKYDLLFDNLRDDNEFKEIVTRANENAAALRARMQQMDEY